VGSDLNLRLCLELEMPLLPGIEVPRQADSQARHTEQTQIIPNDLHVGVCLITVSHHSAPYWTSPQSTKAADEVQKPIDGCIGLSAKNLDYRGWEERVVAWFCVSKFDVRMGWSTCLH
jgi:hypothetical protein